MEERICNSEEPKRFSFACVVARVRKVATSATLPAVLALTAVAGAVTAAADGLYYYPPAGFTLIVR